MPELLALDLALIAFPRPRRPGAVAGRCGCRESPMYTLSKAKEEIDLVAKHATDIAVHALAMSAAMDAKLESFKQDVLSAIDEKFAELGRSIQGEMETSGESSAIADLGAKVSLLSQAAATPSSGDGHAAREDHDSGPDHHDNHQDHPPHEQHWGDHHNTY